MSSWYYYCCCGFFLVIQACFFDWRYWISAFCFWIWEATFWWKILLSSKVFSFEIWTENVERCFLEAFIFIRTWRRNFNSTFIFDSWTFFLIYFPIHTFLQSQKNGPENFIFRGSSISRLSFFKLLRGLLWVLPSPVWPFPHL